MPHASGSRQLPQPVSDAGSPTTMFSLSILTSARSLRAKVTASRVRKPARSFLSKGRSQRRRA
jgi:hypothetical protein